MAPIRVLKKNGQWRTRCALLDSFEPHPTWHLAMLHARHLTYQYRHTNPPTEHLATRIEDLQAWGWTINQIAEATGTPTSVIRKLATLPVGRLRRLAINPRHAQSITTLYKQEATK